MAKGHFENELGSIEISPEVVASYAGAQAVECFGIVGMAAVSMKDGLTKLLRKDSLNHGVQVRLVDNRITIDLHIIVAYGISIQAVCKNLYENVKYRVEDFSGLNVEKLNIHVDGVRIID